MGFFPIKISVAMATMAPPTVDLRTDLQITDIGGLNGHVDARIRQYIRCSPQTTMIGPSENIIVRVFIYRMSGECDK